MANYEHISTPGGGHIKAWTRGVAFEEGARQQVANLADLPFIYKHVAVMPDVHKGIGATVGSVIATRGAIVPAAVGVDLGCGVIAHQTTLMANDLPESLQGLRGMIEAAVPHGGPGDVGSWEEDKVPDVVRAAAGRLVLADDRRYLHEKYPKMDSKYETRQLGTLGTGNHFIEVCLDTKGYVWVMLHSGSRGIGNRIGSFFIEKAKEDMARWYINLVDKDLAYIPEGSDYFEDYVKAVGWAQEYAWKNRELMMEQSLKALGKFVPKNFGIVNTVNCHHNFIAKENHFGDNVWVTRKGAVRAREGEFALIPASMGAASKVVVGRGNPDSFQSCSHGAGRVMSRGEAKKKISLEQHAQDMQGIEARRDADVIDESPRAYKDINGVMAAQSDLVETVETLKQILVVKG